MKALRCLAAFSLMSLISLISLTSLSANAADDDAFKRVASIKLFAFGGIGFAGTTSEGEIAFRKVMASNTAASDLERLLKTGNVQAQCYALVGLRLTQRAVFDEKVKSFTGSRVVVETAGGCILAKKPMSSVVEEIRNGNYDQMAQRELRSKVEG
jgi:hypothetical protein